MDQALLVMKVLFKRDCDTGTVVANTVAQTWLAEAGLDARDYNLGLAQAAHSGWLVPGGHPGTSQMTKAGLAAATKDAN